MSHHLHEVVIVGAGFAGLRAARALKGAPVDVTLIDRRNHHLFQPLLYQVATGGLSPADIAVPIRGLLSKQRNCRVILGEVTGFDVERKLVQLTDAEVSYNTLVVATGATHSYFGKAEWADYAPGLKTLEDATAIRRKILLAFEAAERAEAEQDRERLLTFVVVGGGPTGVEMAGAVAELAHQTLRRDFRSFDPASVRVLLVEGGDRVLPTYSESLSLKAENALIKLGGEVIKGCRVVDITPAGVSVSKEGKREKVDASNVIWAAGVAASPLGKSLAASTDASLDLVGRVVVEADLSLPDHPEIFVAGDLASYSHQTGSPLRGTADVAGAQGAYIADVIRRGLTGRSTAPPFKFRDLGKLAVIGRSAAVVDLPFVRVNGRIAWLFWLFVHLMLLVDFQNRLTVLVQWGWSYLTRKKSARLITGEIELLLSVEGGRPSAIADGMSEGRRSD